MSDKKFGKKPPAKSYYFIGKCARFVSLRLIPFIAKTPIRPLHLSVGSFVCAFISACLYAFGAPSQNRVAVVFFLLFFLADHMDGDLARYKGEESLTGDILDHVVGKLSLVLVYSGIFCGLSKTYNPVFVWCSAFFLMAGFFGFQSLTTKRSLMVQKNDIIDHKFERKDQFTKHDSLGRILFKELTAAYVLSFSLIILGSIFNILIWTMCLAVVHVWLYYASQIVSSLKYFNQVDHQNK